MPKIKLPNGSKFEPIRAMELANLIERAFQQHDFYDNNPGKIWKPEQSKLIGSTVCVPDLSPDAIGICGQVEYKIIATLWSTGHWYFVPETVPFGFIARRTIEDGKPGVFVVFRGTRERPEWFNNFQFRFNQKPFMDNENLGQVSRGFNKIYTSTGEKESICETIYQALKECPQDSRVFVTGHSLGGALATLATLDIATRTDFKKPILYTFASPRVGNPQFATNFENLECYRVANSEDIVTTLPVATGQLVGEEMLEDMTKQQKNTVKSLRRIVSRFTTSLSTQAYQHVGEPLYFTKHKGYISHNHNMFQTYREALPSQLDIECFLDRQIVTAPASER